MHCTIGLLKRPIPQGCDAFAKQIKDLEFELISLVNGSVSLVHARKTSYEFLQEGIVTFPLVSKLDIAEDEFVRKLNLA